MKILLACFLMTTSQVLFALDTLDVCVDYHCERRQQVPVEEADWEHLLEPFSKTAVDAKEERKNIRHAIALFEQLVGTRAPTYKDQPENMGEDVIGQLDCIAESKNTRHYLQWLERKNKLRWHTVGQRVRRAPSFIDVHWGASITDLETGRDYIVDSWYGGNGDLPTIQPVRQWLNKAPMENL